MESRGLRTSKSTGKYAPTSLNIAQPLTRTALKVGLRKKRERQYKRISNETRAEIVRRIMDNKETVAKVSRKLKLRYTTVCSIIDIYKNEGRIDRVKQSQRKKRSKERAEVLIVKKEEEKEISPVTIKSEENCSEKVKVEKQTQIKLENDANDPSTILQKNI